MKGTSLIRPALKIFLKVTLGKPPRDKVQRISFFLFFVFCFYQREDTVFRRKRVRGMLAQQRLRARLDVPACIAGFITKVVLFAIVISSNRNKAATIDYL